MIRKLLLICASILFSVASYAQYGQPLDLTQCNNEVFNLGVNTPVILNGLNPAEYTVTYFQTQADADNNINPLDPVNYVAPQMQVIYARVDHAGQYTVLTFTVQWGFSPNLPGFMDLTVCDAFILAPLPAGAHYFNVPGPPTTPGMFEYFPGDAITQTTEVFVYAGSGMCAAQDSFVVTVIPTFVVENFPDITVCGSYTVPALASGAQFHTAPNGGGTLIPAGVLISTTTTLYINGMNLNPMCYNETSFTITVNPGTTPGLIISPSSTSVCLGGAVTLMATTNADSPVFSWLENGQVVPGATSNAFIAMPMQTSSYQCSISTSCGIVLSEPVVITVTGIGALDITTSGEFCLGGSFTLGIANPDPSWSYVWTHQPEGGSVPVVTASTYSVTSATVEDGGAYTCTAINTCGGMFMTSISVEIGICNNNTISGHVRLDADSNGCTPTDAGMPNVAVVKYAGNEPTYGYTDLQGKYTFSNVQEGAHQVSLSNPPSGYLQTSPAPPGSNGFNVQGNDNALIGDFCMTAPQLVTDVSVSLYANSGARPGFPAFYTLVVYNKGGVAANGLATLNYDPAKLDFVSSSPVNSSLQTLPAVNTLKFDIINLQPFQYKVFTVYYTVKVPPIVNAGDVLQFSAEFDLAGDVNVQDNTAELQQIVVNSYDPNDILVRQGESIYASQVADYLDYTIRFQNTGTADAINVRITNELDAMLDWSTFEPVFASHAFHTERTGNNVTFQFNAINLPAQQDDDAGSNGMVSYRIKPKSNVTVGDIMKAQANIYFDFNLPIVTNEASTEVIEMMGVREDLFANLKMYPNPASGKVTVEFGSDLDAAAGILYDIQGKTIMEAKGFGRSLELNISSVKSGMYFVKIVSGNDSVVRKLIVK